MLSEEFFSSICGPPLANNTAVSKDVGIYAHTLSPSYAVRSTFKKSSTPVNCLAVTDAHIFAAQQDKAYVHVYSRQRGNQEAFVPLPERIRCIALAGDVLLVGTDEGRLMLWETLSGRLISTPPSHVQAITAITSSSQHILTGSLDSNIHIWSLPTLLALDTPDDPSPLTTLSNHRSAITALLASPSTSPHTNLAISASADKTIVLWNYATGTALRILLLSSTPLCMTLDPGARALIVSTDDGALHLVEILNPARPLLGPHAADMSAAVEISAGSAFGQAPPDAKGAASCLALSYDGGTLLTGHPGGKILRWGLGESSAPVELADLNAAVTNLVFVPPLSSADKTLKAGNVVKPSQADRNYTVTAQFEGILGGEVDDRFSRMVRGKGFDRDVLERAVLEFRTPAGGDVKGDEELRRQNEELLEVVGAQRALLKDVLAKYPGGKGGT